MSIQIQKAKAYKAQGEFCNDRLLNTATLFDTTFVVNAVKTANCLKFHSYKYSGFRIMQILAL